MGFRIWIENQGISLYHGSRKKFPDGFRLLPQTTGYAFWAETQQIERVFESVRPPDKISRYEAVFLSDDDGMCERAGGYSDHIYLVQPEGQVDKSDLSWYTECEMYDEPPEKHHELARQYWAGVPFPRHNASCFEYRCRSAIILREINPREGR